MTDNGPKHSLATWVHTASVTEHRNPTGDDTPAAAAASSVIAPATIAHPEPDRVLAPSHRRPPRRGNLTPIQPDRLLTLQHAHSTPPKIEVLQRSVESSQCLNHTVPNRLCAGSLKCTCLRDTLARTPSSARHLCEWSTIGTAEQDVGHHHPWWQRREPCDHPTHIVSR